MADHTITTDTNIHDLDWSDNDNVIVKEGAKFTVDNSGDGLEIWKIGYIKVEYGHLQIDNSEDDGLELLFKEYIFIDIKAEGTMTIDGKLLNTYTSDGTDDQSFPFWDTDYDYQIAGIFVDGEQGMLMDEFSSLDSYSPQNEYIRLHKYDTDNASFGLKDYYIPADGTDIYIPNILIKRDGTDDANVGTKDGYIRIELTDSVSTKGCYHYHQWLTSGAKNVTHQDCVFAKVSYHIGIENLTINNCLTTYDNTSHNAMFVRWCTHVNITNFTYYGKADMESNYDMTCNNWHIFGLRNRNDFITFRDGEDLTLNDFNYVYTENIIRGYKDVKVINPSFRFDDDYSDGRQGLHYAERTENLIVDNIQVCSDFKYNKHILNWTFNINRSIFKNSWIDIYHSNDANLYPDLFILAGSSHNNLIFNCGWTDSKKSSSSRNFLYADTYNNTIINCDIRNQVYYLMGKNQSLKALGAIDNHTASMFGCNSSHIIVKDDDGETVEDRLYFRTGVNDWTIEKSSNDITDDGLTLYFKNKDEYVIFKQTKEMSRFRQLKSITDSSISGNGTDDMSFYISLDKGITWIEKGDWVGTKFPDIDSEVWVKITNDKDRDNHGDGTIKYVYLTVDIDTDKADYKPYFLWTDIIYKNLPDETMYCNFQVNGEDVTSFKTNTTTHLLYELWKENPYTATTKIRKYGYEFYANQEVFNDTSLEFFYTASKKTDITMSESDALAIDGIVLQSSDDNNYKWELDCGGNDLLSVYHYIQAKLTYHNTDFAGIPSFEFNEFFKKDGEKYKCLQAKNGEGIKIKNIPISEQQKISFITDDGLTSTYPFLVTVKVDVGSIAKNDSDAWYQSFGFNSFNTNNAITVLDMSDKEVKGLASDADDDNIITFIFEYDTDTTLGDAGTDKQCVFLCEGNDGATQAKTVYTLTRDTTIAISCSPSIENNA